MNRYMGSELSPSILDTLPGVASKIAATIMQRSRFALTNEIAAHSLRVLVPPQSTKLNCSIELMSVRPIRVQELRDFVSEGQHPDIDPTLIVM